MMHCLILLLLLIGIAASENSTFDESFEAISSAKTFDTEQGTSNGDWSPCTRSCGGGISRQQKRCRRKPCKGRPWNIKYKVCNVQACDKQSDFRSEQCSAFDNIPYNGQLLKWYPYYDPTRLCSLICRGEQINGDDVDKSRDRGESLKVKPLAGSEDTYGDESSSSSSIVVQLAEKVQDGTRCYLDSPDVCVNGECLRVGCDMRVGSNKIVDACGVCGGDGSTCTGSNVVKFAWSLESSSSCSEPCGGGFKIANAVCKSTSTNGNIVDESKCDLETRPNKILLPCNSQPCTTKWLTGDWSACSASCGGGIRTRAVFCTEENENATTKLPDFKCSKSQKPKSEENCNAFSCPMWETEGWSECSVTCGTGIRTRNVECQDGNGRLSNDCEENEKPRTQQECRASIDCSSYADEITQSMIHQYPFAPLPEKLIDQPIPSESTFIPEEWSPCSVTCGEGIRHRQVSCKIFLEFSRTIAKLPDRQCSGPKPAESEKCVMEPCNAIDNHLSSYNVDSAGDSSFVESSLTDSYRSSNSGGLGSYESNVKVASGTSAKTTYSWKEVGYTDCSATCLGGVQDLIITCVRDDNGKTVMPLLCSAETKPESRIRVCNDHPCPPRWNTSDFSECMSPCGLGIQTRDVYCIHEVTRGPGNTVTVPNHMCPQPPPVDRQYCNVWDCPVDWQVTEWTSCSKSCGGGTKSRKVFCEQVMAQGRKQSRSEKDCPSPRPRSEKECNTKACGQSDVESKAVIVSTNSTYNQEDVNKKVELDIGGSATIFHGAPIVKIRCRVKKFDKAHIKWKKNHEDLRKSRKYKINKKGALRIIDINYADAGIYSCIAGQAEAILHLKVKPNPRDQVIGNEEILRSGNAVHQRQGAHLSSAPINSEPAYGTYVYSQETPGSDNFNTHKTTEKPRKKNKKSTSSPMSGQYNSDYAVTPLHQPGYHESVESTATSGASTLVPNLGYIFTTIKSYWPFHGRSNSGSSHKAAIKEESNELKELSSNTMTTANQDFQYETVGSQNYDFFRGNTVFPDNTFGPDEERIFIDDDPFDIEDTIFTIDHTGITKEMSKNKQEKHISTNPSVTLVTHEEDSSSSMAKTRHHHGFTTTPYAKNHRGGRVIDKPDDGKHEKSNSIEKVRKSVEIARGDQPTFAEKLNESKEKDKSIESYEITDGPNEPEVYHYKESTEMEEKFNLTTAETNASTEREPIEISSKLTTKEGEKDVTEEDVLTVPTSFSSSFSTSYTIPTATGNEEIEIRETVNDTTIKTSNGTVNSEEIVINEKIIEGDKIEVIKKSLRNETFIENFFTKLEEPKNFTPIVLGGEVDQIPTIGSAAVIVKDKDDMIFEWVTTDWSRCSQTCGGGGFQMRGVQCTVRTKNNSISTGMSPRTVIGLSLCEGAGFEMPEKVRPCGNGRCPQWISGEWSSCETSRCFNWKTAMQRREVSCQIIEDENSKNATTVDSNKCDEAIRPPQRQECYNDACKGVWRVGEWSECTASCEDDGIKYRILQCVWYGTKKPAGNACRDIPRPPVMKTCKGPPCPKSPGDFNYFSDECKDHSQLCGRVKLLGICRVPLYGNKCCKSCRHERIS